MLGCVMKMVPSENSHFTILLTSIQLPLLNRGSWVADNSARTLPLPTKNQQTYYDQQGVLVICFIYSECYNPQGTSARGQ